MVLRAELLCECSLALFTTRSSSRSGASSGEPLASATFRHPKAVCWSNSVMASECRCGWNNDEKGRSCSWRGQLGSGCANGGVRSHGSRARRTFVRADAPRRKSPRICSTRPSRVAWCKGVWPRPPSLHCAAARTASVAAVDTPAKYAGDLATVLRQAWRTAAGAKAPFPQATFA
eukprot:scaffold299708_cov32-Tisochrysis_lutea.AAC.4